MTASPRSRGSVLLLAGVVALLVGCGQDGPMVLFELPRAGVTSSGYYALPFPNDLRRRSDGTIDLDDHIRPNDLLAEYLDVVAAKTDGFGTNSALFVRFAGEIDPASLPASPAESRADGASVYLVDVDSGSPSYGERQPLWFRFERWAGESIGPNWLGCLPFPGFPLRSSTTYALVVTDRVKGVDGGGVVRSADLEAVLAMAGDTDSVVTAARAVYQPLLDYLDQAGGDQRGDVAAAAVFTTQDATGLMGRVRTVIGRDVAAPVARDLVRTGRDAEVSIYQGVYDAPNFQTGDPPYTHEGGEIVVDAAGDPVVQRMESLRFALTVPRGTVPATGWPIVLYAHGTGGDYRSFIDNDTYRVLAGQGLAVISIDQPLHGDRSPSGSATEESFFNYTNPIAGRDNVRQGALDDFQLTRLAATLILDDAVTEEGECRFDPDRILFMGHSQGGITGALFVPYEPRVRGAVLSGAGGDLYQTLLHKEGVAELVATIVRDYPLDQWNNLLALVQMFAEPSDPVNYGPLLVREPPPENSAKEIFQSEGFLDSYTPAITIEALGVAIGGSPVEPLIQSVDGFALRGVTPLAPPVTGNLDGHTAVFLQYQARAGDDGHYVVFDVLAARRQHSEFLGSLARDGHATLNP